MDSLAGVCDEEAHMPGDPKEYRKHAKRCLQLADETTNQVLKDSLTDVAERWTRLATDLEATGLLLDELR
jgi:hypothetical protein